jgi:hypothetical protein
MNVQRDHITENSDESAAPQTFPQVDNSGEPAHPWRAYARDPSDPSDPSDDATAARPKAQASRSRNVFDVDPARLETLAAELDGDIARVSARLGCARSTLRSHLHRREDLRAAFNRGRARGGLAPLRERRQKAGETEVAARATDVPDDDLVMSAVREGQETFGDIMRRTALSNARVVAAIVRLEESERVRRIEPPPLTRFVPRKSEELR